MVLFSRIRLHLYKGPFVAQKQVNFVVLTIITILTIILKFLLKLIPLHINMSLFLTRQFCLQATIEDNLSSSWMHWHRFKSKLGISF